ncbi:UNVERIFIED_CONTAM: hypothetical protein K2H54_001973 [Gekko kuhli]
MPGKLGFCIPGGKKRKKRDENIIKVMNLSLEATSLCSVHIIFFLFWIWQNWFFKFVAEHIVLTIRYLVNPASQISQKQFALLIKYLGGFALLIIINLKNNG